ncbi:MAG TPA: hypothetical protein VM163_01420 [bacterium]|nr:hypothetical protein [bacterium]
MNQDDAKRKSRRFWSLDILWLLPWGILLFVCAFLYIDGWISSSIPMLNPCRMSPETMTAKARIGEIMRLSAPVLKVLIAAMLIPLFFLRWWLRKRGLGLLWRLAGIAAAGGMILILYSLTFTYMEEGIRTRALGDCRNISTGILLFHEDTGEWPYYCLPFDDPDRKPCIDYLYGNMGDMPDLYEPAWETWGTVSDDMFFHLVKNGRERPFYFPVATESTMASSTRGWKQPYLPYVVDDPWANKYLVSVGAFEGGRLKGSYVWCISAGPNECLETPTTASETQGDDIGYRTK